MPTQQPPEYNPQFEPATEHVLTEQPKMSEKPPTAQELIKAEKVQEKKSVLSEKETVPVKEVEKIEPPKDEEGFMDETISNLKKKLRAKKKKQITIPQVKDPVTVQIEQIMEEGLGDAYSELTPVQKQEFKIKGEETAWEIRKILGKTRIKFKEIFKLVIEWLKMLPGVNRFFMEQEAKIKVDRIIALSKRK